MEPIAIKVLKHVSKVEKFLVSIQHLETKVETPSELRDALVDERSGSNLKRRLMRTIYSPPGLSCKVLATAMFRWRRHCHGFQVIVS